MLTKLAGIIDAKSGIPILHNVFIDVCAATIFLRATDNDLQLVIPCPAEVTSQGQITVDGQLLHEIVRKCPKAGQIGVTLGGASKRRKASSADADRLRLTCGSAEFTLLTLPADDWPQLHLGPGAAEFRLECRQLRALIEKTRFAISTDETRYYLGGIYLHANGENLAAVATDGHRLAVKTVDRRELMPRSGYPTAHINASTSEGQLGSQVQAITGIDGANASPKGGQNWTPMRGHYCEPFDRKIGVEASVRPAGWGRSRGSRRPDWRVNERRGVGELVATGQTNTGLAPENSIGTAFPLRSVQRGLCGGYAPHKPVVRYGKRAPLLPLLKK